jgi:hypothetical protein
MTLAQWNSIQSMISMAILVGCGVLALRVLFGKANTATCLGRAFVFIGAGCVMYAFSLHFDNVHAKLGSATLHGEMQWTFIGILCVVVGLTSLVAGYLVSRAKPKEQNGEKPVAA